MESDKALLTLCPNLAQCLNFCQSRILGPLLSDSGPAPAARGDYCLWPPPQLWASCPCLPRASHSLITPGLLPCPLTGTTVYNPLSPYFPFPQHTHLPLLILCQQLVTAQCQIKQMWVVLAGTCKRTLWQPWPWPGLSLNWLKAGRALYRQVVRFHRHWLSVFPPWPPDILFISLCSAPLSLLCCLFVCV